MTDFDTFFEKIKQRAAKSFTQDGEFRPTFFVQGDNGKIGVLDAVWENNADKARKCIAIRCGIDLGIYKQACFVTEAWLANYAKDVDVAKAPPPSERVDRQECLMIVGLNDKISRIGFWPIGHDKWKPQLGAFEIMDNMTPMSAAFGGLTREAVAS